MIQWNKVTWYSKIVALVLFVGLPFVGFYFGEQYGKSLTLANTDTTPVSTTNQNVLQNDYYSNTAEWQSDSNSNLFTISYPIDFNTADNYSAAPSTDWRLSANGIPGIKYFTLTVPRAFEPQTNFADATFTIGASKNSLAIAQCLNQDMGGGPGTSSSTATINGIQFAVASFSGAGAGNLYQTTSYRTLHAGQCFAIEYTIHSSQIGDYPTSYNLKPFNQQKITSLFQNMVGTFSFL